MGQNYNCEVLPSDYRFQRDPAGGLTIYKPVISVHRTSQPADQAVEGFLIRRSGCLEEILKITSSGGGAKEASQGGDDMVLDQDMFVLVKHIAKELLMRMYHVYDTQAGGEY